MSPGWWALVLVMLMALAVASLVLGIVAFERSRHQTITVITSLQVGPTGSVVTGATGTQNPSVTDITIAAYNNQNVQMTGTSLMFVSELVSNPNGGFASPTGALYTTPFAAIYQVTSPGFLVNNDSSQGGTVQIVLLVNGSAVQTVSGTIAGGINQTLQLGPMNYTAVLSAGTTIALELILASGVQVNFRLPGSSPIQTVNLLSITALS